MEHPPKIEDATPPRETPVLTPDPAVAAPLSDLGGVTKTEEGDYESDFEEFDEEVDEEIPEYTKFQYETAKITAVRNAEEHWKRVLDENTKAIQVANEEVLRSEFGKFRELELETVNRVQEQADQERAVLEAEIQRLSNKASEVQSELHLTRQASASERELLERNLELAKTESTKALLEVREASQEQEITWRSEMEEALASLQERIKAEQAAGHTKAVEELEKKHADEIEGCETQYAAVISKASSLESELVKATTEVTTLSEKMNEGQENAEAEILAFKSESSRLKDALNGQIQAVGHLETSYHEEMRLRKKYYNTIETMKGKIRVFARCRPMDANELKRSCKPIVDYEDEYTIKVKVKSNTVKPFLFDAAFTPEATQEEVFEDCRRLVQSCMDGFNVCIFAYGQTGSGKTHTMTGSRDNPGILPRAVQEEEFKQPN